MIIDNSNIKLKKTLRVLDRNGERVESIVWFNTSTLVGSTYKNGKEERFEANQFCFVGNPMDLERLLPPELYLHIVPSY